MENYFFETETDADDDKVYVLIIYDIVENKRRLQLAKFLQGYGFRVQKSSFEAKISRKKYLQLIKRIGEFAGEEDSIRVYKIIGNGQVTVFGNAMQIEDEDVIII